MRRGKWVVIGVALGMMAATAGWLTELRNRVNLGDPGVKVEPAALYRKEGGLVSPRCVVLPTNVPGFESAPSAITEEELGGLPEDTTFGRRLYAGNGLRVQLGVVLMGRDHTSIHQPQYCLKAQDWTVTNSERIVLHVSRPFAYDVPAIKLDATHLMPDGQMVHCIYVYWFVCKDKITAEEGSRLWSMWTAVLGRGVTERWAYISYFVTCHSGQESDTMNSLRKFIEATVPEFQTVTGGGPGRDFRGAGAGNQSSK
jgi:hypothetical protein